jgi:peptide/nickel transport system permease protein
VGLGSFALRRTAALVAVVVVAVSGTWLTAHVLRPNRFPDDGRPLLVELGDYLQRAFLHFDLGRSTSVGRRPVAELLLQGLPADLWLLGGAVLFGIAAGLAGGVVCAARPGSLVARGLQAVALFFLCAPVYVVGMALLLLLGSGIALLHVGVVPTRYVPFGEDPLRWLGSLIVPWVVLGLPLAALCLRMMRAQMLEALKTDCLRTALAKGLRERTALRRHAMPLAAAPAVTLAGASIPVVVTNLVLVERVFQIPGVLSRMQGALATADFPVLFGLTFVVAALVALATLLVDLVLAWLDPRTRAAT